MEQQPGLFPYEDPRDKDREDTAAVKPRWPRQNEEYGERNPGTQRMIDDLGGGEPRESDTAELPSTPRSPRKHRPSHVRDLESDRDHQLAAERAAYHPPTPEEIAASEQYAPVLHELLDDLAEAAITASANSEGVVDPDFARPDQKERDAAQARALIRARRERRQRDK